MDTEKQRQSRCDDVRLTESGNTRSEQLLVMPYRVTNQQRMAAMRALEWIRTSKAWLVLDMKYLTCSARLDCHCPRDFTLQDHSVQSCDAVLQLGVSSSPFY